MRARLSTVERKQSSASFPDMLTPPTDTSLDTYESLSSSITPDLTLPDIQWTGLERNEDVSVEGLMQAGDEPSASSTFVFSGDNVPNKMVGGAESIPSSGRNCIDDDPAGRITFKLPEYHEQQQAQLDSTMKVIEDISTLNLRIYKATATFPQHMLRDEMIEMSSTFLRIVARLVDLPRKSRPKNHQSAYPVGSQPCRRDSIDPSLNSVDFRARMPDTANFMMAYSCYQRLLELFKKVLLNLHRKVGRSYRKEGIPPPSVANRTSGDIDFSTAHVVMTLELINHLLRRLHRGLHQLVAALSVGVQPPYSPETMPLSSFSCESMNSPDMTSGSAPQPKPSPSSDDLSDSSSQQRATSCFQGAKSVIEIMEQSQSSLYVHIKLIKAFIEESHGF